MSGEAGDIPGLDPAIGRARLSRARWGRRSPGRADVGFGNDRGGATYAALDLGTNNCRLLVARPSGEGFRVVDAFSRIVRLGEGVSIVGPTERCRYWPRPGGAGHLPQQDEKQRA